VTDTNDNIIPFPVARLPHRQLGLFAGTTSASSSNGIVGLVTTLAHRPCRSCGSVAFTIGSSKAMHNARLTCADCGAFAGWLSKGGCDFIRISVEKYGLPPAGRSVE
jgi:hypothetical protein